MKSIRKRVAAIGVAGTMLIGAITAAGIGISDHIYNKSSEKRAENEIGYDNIDPYYSYRVSEKDFVVLDVGDHATKGVMFQDKKMKLCNKDDISLGVVINSDAESESEIYDDAQYAKGLVRDYKIDFPIYLNVDNIVESNKIEPLMKEKLIRDFLEKCSANNIYVGIAGKDMNLHLLEQYYDFSDYDAYITENDGSINYEGTYNLVKDNDGKITAKDNLAKVINKKGLNDSKGFSEDGTYIVEDAMFDLIKLSFSSNMSIDEICEYNDLNKDELVPGVKLRIPTQTNVNSTGKQKKVNLDSPIVGADMSYAQGNNHDWDKLKDNFDYIILKCNQGTEVDSCFEKNAKGCNINNIPMGVYTYNNYDVTNCSDIDDFEIKQKNQVRCTLSNLKNKKVEFPVYLDIEASDGKALKDLLSSEYVKTMLDVWKDNVEAAGYTPGVYCNSSGYQYLSSCVDYDLSDKFELWVAGGDQYTSSKKDINFKDVVPSSVLEKDYVSMAQSTDSAVKAGAGNSAGHLDINFSKFDYEYVPSGIDEIKEFNRTSGEEYLVMGLGGLVGVGGICYGVKKLYNRRKQRIR